jgi:CRP-like cAMP-binding protein
MITSPEER